MAESMNIAIVGAAGKMGSWFAALLHGQGHDLLLVDTRRGEVERLAGSMERCRVGQPADAGGADVVIIAVPVDAVEPAMRELSAYVREGQAVIDLSSLKGAPQRAAEKHLPRVVFLGVHPMFGAGADGLAGHNVILTPVGERSRDLAARVQRYVEPQGAHVVTMSPDEHDEVMAVVLLIPALVVAVVARTILDTGRLAEAREVSGTSLEVLMALTESMLGVGSSLYSTLLAALPAAPSVASALELSAAHFSRLVRDGDRDGLLEEFNTLGRELGSVDRRASDAYGRMYAMLEALQRYPTTPRPKAGAEDPQPPSTC
ncbi:MAG: prephenate dehydrogenase/arogenate dehydrogenase family protein [Chloroflexi bacterium]|nr:prephenate dehydrogenase/arogenate dehydrogenase family protein [Chloroflexota bacterium]